MAASSSAARARRLLGGALDREIALLDHRVAQVWQVMMVLIILLAITVTRVSMLLGLWCAALGLVGLCWFTLYASLVKRGRAGKTLSVITTVVEAGLPWAFLIISYTTDGAAYALGSWVAPLMVMFLIMTATMRLRPLAPLVIGVAGGATFPLLYFLVLRHGLHEPYASMSLYQPILQITRGFSLGMAGMLGMLISRALRRAIAKAEASQRQRDLFGKYRLIREVASGGMGIVHEALYCPEGGFERRVAVKRVHPHLAEQDTFVSAFRNEAEISASLVHNNIVQVFDFGRIDESYFLAMEFVEGITLQQLMQRAREAGIVIPATVVAHIANELLHALDYSHRVARGSDGQLLRVIHRDLSPRNVLLSLNGEVKLSDFGVAKALREATSAGTAHVGGSYGYMAPEQAQAEPLDERCDLFSLGVILWELLTGERLFHRGAPAPTLMALVSAEVAAPSTKREGLSLSWDRLLGQALERDRGQRHDSASAMLEELGAVEELDGVPSPQQLAALIVELPEAKHASGSQP